MNIKQLFLIACIAVGGVNCQESSAPKPVEASIRVYEERSLNLLSGPKFGVVTSFV
jgi:hypothetical protein